MSKKPRSDAKLKLLPEERQEQIVAWANTPKSENCVGGLAYAQEQLAADGIKISISTLGDFVSWWRLERRFARAESKAEQIAQMAARLNPEMSPERVRAIAASVFTLEAVESGDAETYVNLEHLRLKRESAEFKGKIDTEKLALAREKFEVQFCEKFLHWYGVRKARSIAESNLSNSEKIAALRAEFFKDVDELERDGSVQLPQ